MADGVKGFIIYRKFYMGISLLSCEQKGKLLEALFADMGEGEMPNLDPVTQAIFSMMLPSVHDAQSAFSRRSEASRENGRLGGRPKKGKDNTEVSEFTEEKNKPSEKPRNLKNLQVSENLNRIDKNRIDKNNTPYIPQSCELSLFDMSSASPSVCESSPLGEKKGSSKEKAAGYSEDFEKFWQAYPKKVSKGQAWKTWEKLRKAKELPNVEELCKAISWRKLSEDWEKDNGRFIPHPSTWLNAHGWEDEACKEPPDDPRNDPREEEAYRIANSMGGFMPLREECGNTRLYWERMVRINEALEAAGYGEFGTNKDLIAMNLGEKK